MSPWLNRILRPSWRGSPWNSDQLLREELFGVERLEEHAASLAAAQQVCKKPVSRPRLGVRLTHNEAVLLGAYRTIAEAVGQARSVTPAANWLLDNYPLVEEQIREIRQDLPPGFYRQLPKLATGPFIGYPRIFGLAWAFVAHTDSRFDPDVLCKFVSAYQRVQPLTIGELWAVAITLRIVLVENLTRAAQRIVHSRIACQEADCAVDELLGLNGHASDAGALKRRYAEQTELPRDFAVQLVQRLRDQDPNTTPALLWLEERLISQGTTSAEIVHDEHQQQGASNVTVRNIITSMRRMADVDWPELFERVSLVDETLRCASGFAEMDFATRNLYRTAIEQLARRSQLSELQIAERAVREGQLAAALSPGPNAARTDEPLRPKVSDQVINDEEMQRRRDPGYCLIGPGRQAFETAIAEQRPLQRWIRAIHISMDAASYVAAIVALSALILALPLWSLHAWGQSGFRLGLLALLGLIPATELAVALINRAIMRWVQPTILPGLALREGVSPHLRTMVVVPILLTSREALAEQVEHLEIHHLASPEGELHFALLSDWGDATAESMPGDTALLASATAGIAALNRTYPAPSGGDRFLLLHRRRRWSESQQQWIGWERKRGKLHELNALLRGATDTSFVGLDGQSAQVPSGVRFVITLDADTRLPRDAARRLIGKLAHPLNRPRFDPISGRVVAGHAVLQPRVTPSLPVGRDGSLFQRILSSSAGIDPYAAAASDVYQDLFGEGSYAGKGIYDVDAFEAALHGRVPADTMLSHDLFEGIFARAGLASDVEVVEDFPARYDVAARRHHRWVRGDWQLLPWLLGRRDTATPPQGRSPELPLIGRWKIIDNLRRSLTAPMDVVSLLAGWLLLPAGAAALWSGFIVLTLALPTLLPVLAAILPRRTGITARSHARAFRVDLGIAAAQTGLLVIFLAHQAWLMADAIGRTLFRLLVSHRKLLEWVTAAQANMGSRLSLSGMVRHMRGGMISAALALLVTAIVAPQRWWIALPFVLLWLASPLVACFVSEQPRLGGRRIAGPADERWLRLIARRTWRFFETFVTADDHMLPPDNFQEDPKPVIAHRTSPTNIGLYLLSIVSARDMGWIGANETTARLEQTLATMGRLQRFRGHLYNWYDTEDLRPLDPRYVSSVDSGNLAGHLLAVANACRGWIGEAGPPAINLAGINDALELTIRAAGALPTGPRGRLAMRRELSQGLQDLSSSLAAMPLLAPAPRLASLAHLQQRAATLCDITGALGSDAGDDLHGEVIYWSEATRHSIECCHRDQELAEAERQNLRTRWRRIAETAQANSDAMDFSFLVNPERKLLSIGYRAVEEAQDPNCYDLLASEARLASFVAIAKGDVLARHWFRLGRNLTPIAYGAALISWSGSMFEYLMPSLVMRAPAGSLLERTSRLIVRRQISYAAGLGIPWGISESAFNARDLELTYQYSNFGVPGLGLKRGLSENAVIAPYATALAAMVDPEAAARNFEYLTAEGASGKYGFYEALDYTRSRLPESAGVVIVRAFMAHHQGMTIAAIANAVLNGRMRERFHAQPSIQATELLLQERSPRDVSASIPRVEEVTRVGHVSDLAPADVRVVRTPHDAVPQTHLLSNGQYAVMFTAAGAGYSRWRNLAVTRWREDTTREDCGAFIFLRDSSSNECWSAAYQPCGTEPDSYKGTFTEDRAEIIRGDGTLITTLEVLVSPEDAAEVRRVSISNSGFRTREIEITSYSEVVLAPLAADLAHPAFSNLFIQTEWVSTVGAILATRRRRAPGEAELWAAHHTVLEGQSLGPPEVETDRARFIGRGREIRSPAAMSDGHPLSHTTGTVLDPIFAIRRRVRIAPGATARVAFWTAVATTRQLVLDLVAKHHEPSAYARASMLAWTQAQVQLRHLGISSAEAALFQRLGGYALYSDAALRPSSEAIQRGAGGPAMLWCQGISGDLPIVLLRIDAIEDIAIARQLLQAHEYWRQRQFAVDLVILNERASSYLQELQVALETALRVSQSRPKAGGDGSGGSVFVLRTDLISAETRAMLSAAARIVLHAQRGSLEDQLDRVCRPPAVGVPRQPAAIVQPESSSLKLLPEPLEFFNGLGGFARTGREYVTVLGVGQSTPAPWINVIANPHFGFQVSVEGSGYTWSLNSQVNQLTPWSNDAVSDRPGEVIYLRDEESGELWTPTAAPIRDEDGVYRTRHGQGYSRFEYSARGIETDLVQFVPLGDSIKISRLRVRNCSPVARRLSVTAYVEWVLGRSRSASAPHVVTHIDSETGALLANSPWRTGFDGRVAFVDMGGRQTQWTGDRAEFLGRHGTLAAPAALLGLESLSMRVGAGLDPCCAMQTTLELEPGAANELVVFLGEAANIAELRSMLTRYRAADTQELLHAVDTYWDNVLETVQVQTPDRSLDLILNRWMLYQTLACRMWARAGFYQASGAYGFRDQLQDGMAVALATPHLTREHLLRAAARQFTEGDVQHWWLPHSGQGVRTRISDDRLWLAYATRHYVVASGDLGILDEPIAFLEGQALRSGEHDAYFQPQAADEMASLYEHCARAIDGSLNVGDHGLPLMGTGDWNDGMNRVGELGRGESVWLGWFLYATLTQFAPIAHARGDDKRSECWLSHARALRLALESAGWDGEWYRRAYFDDGSPLGSGTSEECRIDSIAQSWSVMSGAANPSRGERAMWAVDQQLVRRDSGLALLFAEPFEHTELEPGYIKSYPPGIRENGGQYTHAATWSVIALAMLGNGDTAAELLALLNPVNRTSTRASVQRYKVEPYVVAADVYSRPPHVGRGGWTWYTGSAGWMYRAGLEWVLGFRRRGATLTVDPCVPRHWPQFTISYRHLSSRYEILVENPEGLNRGVSSVELDGRMLPLGEFCIPLVDDGAVHRLRVTLGETACDAPDATERSPLPAPASDLLLDAPIAT